MPTSDEVSEKMYEKDYDIVLENLRNVTRGDAGKINFDPGFYDEVTLSNLEHALKTIKQENQEKKRVFMYYRINNRSTKQVSFSWQWV